MNRVAGPTPPPEASVTRPGGPSAGLSGERAAHRLYVRWVDLAPAENPAAADDGITKRVSGDAIVAGSRERGGGSARRGGQRTAKPHGPERVADRRGLAGGTTVRRRWRVVMGDHARNVGQLPAGRGQVPAEQLLLAAGAELLAESAAGQERLSADDDGTRDKGEDRPAGLARRAGER